MKEAILNYFLSDRSYNGGITLVMKYSNKLGFKRRLNLEHESDYLLGIVHEELRELAGINSSEFMRLTRLPIVKHVLPVESVHNVQTDIPVEDDGIVTEVSFEERKQKPQVKAKSKSPKKVSRKK